MKFWHVYRHWRVYSLVLASFSISLPSSKLTISLISIYKHYAFDIADPGSMQDMCHMNFVIDLAHRGVSVAQWQCIGARNPKVWGSIPHGLRIFSLSHARDKTKKTSFSCSCMFTGNYNNSKLVMVNAPQNPLRFWILPPHVCSRLKKHRGVDDDFF